MEIILNSDTPIKIKAEKLKLEAEKAARREALKEVKKEEIKPKTSKFVKK